MADINELKVRINDSISKEFYATSVNSKRAKKRKRLEAPNTSNMMQSSSTTEQEELEECCAESYGEVSEKSLKLPFDQTEIYTSNLTSMQTIAPVDSHYKAFMVQEFDGKKNTLKDSYVVIQRRVLKTPEGYKWYYCCSCNNARQQILLSLPDILTDDVEKDINFEEGPYAKCLHIMAAEPIIQGFDEDQSMSPELVFKIEEPQTTDHNYEKQTAKIDIHGIGCDNTVLCVRLEELGGTTYSIIRVDYSQQGPQLKCSSCRIENCQHVKAVLSHQNESSDFPQNIKDALNAEIKWRSRYVPQSVSCNKIPFSCGLEEQKLNRRNFEYLKMAGEFIHLIPTNSGNCICGNGWGEEQEEGNIRIYTMNDILQAKSYYRPCLGDNCRGVKEYDGCEDQLLNMGTYIVSHGVLRNYLKQFVTHGCTLTSFYKQWFWQQLESGNTNFSEEFQYNRFRYAWYSFLQLLDIEYGTGFVCPECGDCPETVVMDGVTLGLRKAFIPWKNYISKNHCDITYDGSSHNTRVFVNNAETRKLLAQYCNEGLGVNAFNTLREKLAIYQPTLNALFENFWDNGLFKAPETYKNFILTLSSNYPVCGFIHYNHQIFNILSNYNESLNPTNIIFMEQQVPVLSAFFKKLGWKIPDFINPILLELVKKAKEPFDGRRTHDIPLCDSHCECRGFGYFPSLETLCHRGNYVLDDKRTKSETKCTKRNSTHPSLIPGLFTVSCVHGICYGYEVMEDAESPNIPFTILRTKFYKAPKLIIYDNACNLHQYCLNRDPVFFRDSWFLVDRFHWCNHVGCHSGYNLDQYLQYSTINTQVAEQRNSTFKRLKSMLSYMNLDNFKEHINLFIWFRNMLSLASGKHDLTLPYFQLFVDLGKIYTCTSSK